MTGLGLVLRDLQLGVVVVCALALAVLLPLAIAAEVARLVLP